MTTDPLRTRRALVFAAALLAALVAMLPPAGAAPVEAEHGMVVAAQHYASEAGLRILEAGGNAVDAAVGVGYALAVVDPCCGNIGGGGFMVIRLADGRETFIDFRETAPKAARADMYLDAAGAPIAGLSLHGWLAAGVPGTVAGLDRSLRQYGRMNRTDVMAPAIALARDGFILAPSDSDLLNKADRLAQDPAAAEVFRRKNGNPWALGDRLVQGDLANTLSLIARDGPEAFYHGPISAAVTQASSAGAGILTAEDFADYHADETAPLACSYRGYRLVSAPPPSGGGTTVCEILGVIQGSDINALGFHTAPAVHIMVEAMRHAYLDRNTWLGDPDFIANPVAWLLSPHHAAQIRAAIEADKATPSAAVQAGTLPHERPETTHFSIVDRDGNAVAVTYTINGNFGAGVMAPGTGFLLNNEMDDFTIKPGTPNLFALVQGTANAIAPGKRPLSSMSPTIVEKDGRPVFVLGSPGGSRIITAVLETVMNLVDYGMAPQAAVDAPRLHHQWLPDRVFFEPDALAPEATEALRRMGYDLVEQPPWGAVELIAIDPRGRLYGINDRRRPAGAAIGY